MWADALTLLRLPHRSHRICYGGAPRHRIGGDQNSKPLVFSRQTLKEIGLGRFAISVRMEAQWIISLRVYYETISN